MATEFEQAVARAFGPLMDDLGFEFLGRSEDEWFAALTYQRGAIQLRISDDRRDRLIEVVVLRPLAQPGRFVDLGDD